MKRALLIAYHFPPIRHSSGIQRTLKFTSYLRDHGWQPLVLSVNPRAYQMIGDDLMGDIPDDVVVRRAFALDTARHLTIAGRYPQFLALPDRYMSWLPGGVLTGLKMIRQYQPEVIWSTFPVATALNIGAWLQRLSGLPWVADFRDSMVDEGYPSDPRMRRSYERVEERTIARCSRAVFTTPGTRDMYAARYPEYDDSHWAVIPNGYDEEHFRDAEALAATASRQPEPRPQVLVHAGVLYPDERDPRPFFQAIATLKQSGEISGDSLRIVLRATGHDELFQPMLVELGIQDIVLLEPAVAYREALSEMLQADGLLLFQAANCNRQIPAKLYEYLRAGRPILALTDPVGDTATTLREAGTGRIVRLDNSAEIAAGLQVFIRETREGRFKLPDAAVVSSYDRARGAQRLAALFDEVVSAQDR